MNVVRQILFVLFALMTGAVAKLGFRLPHSVMPTLALCVVGLIGMYTFQPKPSG